MQTAEYEIMYRVEETHWWYRALHRLIFSELERLVPGWREQRVLDAGCGTGAVLQRLGNSSRHVGIDLSSEAVRFCANRGLDNVMQGDVAAMPFADASFDAVICSSVLYHLWVRDVAVAIRELRRVLKPGGVLLVNLPAYEFLSSPHDEAVFTARRFTKPEVRSLFAAHEWNFQRLTYWTTLPFPAALLARTLRVSNTGRDFEDRGPWSRLANSVMDRVMQLEAMALSVCPMPFGVALFGSVTKAE